MGRRPARWQPWLALGLFGFLLHFVWELLQAPLYEHMHASRHWSAVLQCSWATVGDVVVTWTAYALATAYHETASTMQPIRENGTESYFTRMYDVTGARPKLAAGSVQDRWWLGASHRGRPLTVFLGVGLVMTVVLEWLSVYVWRRWVYSADMPVVLGISLAPIVQWLLVPLVTLWLARKQLGMAGGAMR